MAVVINGTTGVSTPGVANSGNETITGTLAVTGAATAGSLQVGGVATNLQPLVSGTAVASTSGTSIDFTSIPSWVKRITLLFNGVSTNGTVDLQIQVGTGGTPTTTGYSSGSARASGATAAGTSSSTGFNIYNNSAAIVLSGAMTISLLGSDTWVSSHSMGFGGSGLGAAMGGGSVTLGGTLNMVRVTVNGTVVFDAGSINILYE